MAKSFQEIAERFDFNRAAIAKQRIQNLRHAGGKVRGNRIANLLRTAGIREESEIDDELITQLDEVLTKDDSASKWIHDFVHSTNPKFEGKSKKERIKMALGAYYGQQNEGYQSFSGRSHGHAYGGGGFGRREREDDEYHVPDPTPVAPVPDRKYIKGTPEHKAYKATKKPINGHPTNEEVEQIDEKSEQARRNKIMKNVMDASKGAQFNRTSGLGIKPGDTGHQNAQQMNKALGRALRKEDLDESVKTTHENPLVTVHDKHGLHTHAHLSTANKIFNTNVKHTDVHSGPVTTKDGHETKRDLTFAISKHHEIEMKKEEFQQFISQLQLEEEIVQRVLEAANQYAGLEKEDKPGKVKTAIVKTHQNAVGSETVEGWKDAKKPVKESYDEEGNLITMPKTFQEFMEGMIATKVAPNVTRYTGGSYGNAKGAKYGNTDYDKETLDNKDEEGEEQQKRGRGRPAGAKSGARGPRIK